MAPPSLSEPRLDPTLLQGFVLPLLASLEGLAASGQRGVVALNGPVGAGKTTLCRELERRAAERGFRLAVASIDDLYLPWEERQRCLAGNPFGVSRVPPGSHDVALLLLNLERWRRHGVLVLPRFDKTLRDGQGDRCGEQVLQADVLLLEGWLMGCRPLGGELLAGLEPGPACQVGSLAEDLAGLTPEEIRWLPHWDRALAAYVPLWNLCRSLWLLWPNDWRLARRWRFQAEARQRRSGGAWLAPAALEQLVRSSLCSLPPSLYQEPLLAAASGLARLDGRRRCLALHGPAVRSPMAAADQLSAASSASVG
jgi:D-glycerate 3-kinase